MREILAYITRSSTLHRSETSELSTQIRFNLGYGTALYTARHDEGCCAWRTLARFHLNGAINAVSQGLINGLYIVPILAVLILVHEIGHFVAARLIGAKVEEFGIGIPPRIKGWYHKGVLWSINWIPFGGFVKVLGEDGKSADPGSINTKSPAQRAVFLGAGSFMNFLLAVVLMILVVGFQGVSQTNVYILSVVPGSPAEAAGWQAGDRVVEVAGVPIKSTADVGQRAREFAGRPMSVVVERDTAQIEPSVVPRANPPAGEGPTGVNVRDYAVADASVQTVTPDSAAAGAGFQPGDLIISINGQPVDDAFGFDFAIRQASATTVPVQVVRGGEETSLTVSVPQLDPNADLLPQLGFELSLYPHFESVPLSSVIPVGVAQAWEQSGQM